MWAAGGAGGGAGGPGGCARAGAARRAVADADGPAVRARAHQGLARRRGTRLLVRRPAPAPARRAGMLTGVVRVARRLVTTTVVTLVRFEARGGA